MCQTRGVVLAAKCFATVRKHAVESKREQPVVRQRPTLPNHVKSHPAVLTAVGPMRPIHEPVQSGTRKKI